MLSVKIKRQVGPPHELKKTSLTTPFLLWSNEIYTWEAPNSLLLFKAQWLPLTDAMTRGAFGNPTVPFSFWELAKWGERKAQKPFLASLFFIVTSLMVQWISNEMSLAAVTILIDRCPWINPSRACCCTEPPFPLTIHYQPLGITTFTCQFIYHRNGVTN